METEHKLQGRHQFKQNTRESQEDTIFPAHGHHYYKLKKRIKRVQKDEV